MTKNMVRAYKNKKIAAVYVHGPISEPEKQSFGI